MISDTTGQQHQGGTWKDKSSMEHWAQEQHSRVGHQLPKVAYWSNQDIFWQSVSMQMSVPNLRIAKCLTTKHKLNFLVSRKIEKTIKKIFIVNAHEVKGIYCCLHLLMWGKRTGRIFMMTICEGQMRQGIRQCIGVPSNAGEFDAKIFKEETPTNHLLCANHLEGVILVVSVNHDVGTTT